jgi:hypothetical protein
MYRSKFVWPISVVAVLILLGLSACGAEEEKNPHNRPNVGRMSVETDGNLDPNITDFFAYEKKNWGFDPILNDAVAEVYRKSLGRPNVAPYILYPESDYLNMCGRNSAGCTDLSTNTIYLRDGYSWTRAFPLLAHEFAGHTNNHNSEYRAELEELALSIHLFTRFPEQLNLDRDDIWSVRTNPVMRTLDAQLKHVYQVFDMRDKHQDADNLLIHMLANQYTIKYIRNYLDNTRKRDELSVWSKSIDKMTSAERLDLTSKAMNFLYESEIETSNLPQDAKRKFKKSLLVLPVTVYIPLYRHNRSSKSNRTCGLTHH